MEALNLASVKLSRVSLHEKTIVPPLSESERRNVISIVPFGSIPKAVYVKDEKRKVPLSVARSDLVHHYLHQKSAKETVLVIHRSCDAFPCTKTKQGQEK
ncbi:hypothetical protein CDAR_463591 [Caerostris darwini]|uniref:Uncharacterized protein n=1 Tax=Caerostris darwini TaxID=1538125 RepID=A0AAV4RPL3_9ARAC|nr:hypothetical protein CDAR_463591 [Caerostris darwini]